MSMADLELGAVQERFAGIVWAHEPVSSGELVKLCQRELGWKKPTTYTVLRKLCEKGRFQNAGGVVSSLVSREDFYASKSRQIVETSYHGSLPAFVAAFTASGSLTEEEADALQALIDKARKEG
jgi:predicted transcriptional regulator